MRTLTTVYVTGVEARPREIIKIPMNIQGAGVHFVFDDDWAGLIKNVVFIGVEAAEAANASDIVETVAVANAPDIVEIPAEMVGAVGTHVSVGICGLSADGEEIIPTLWADLGIVWPSAEGDFPPPAERGLPVWAQIQAQLNEAQEGVERSGSELFKDPVSGKVYLMRGERKLGEGVVVGNDSLSFDSGYVDKEGYLHLTQGGVDVAGFSPIYVGFGGGNDDINFNVSLTSLNESRIITVPEGQRVVLRFNYSSVDDVGIDDGNGMGQLIVGGIVRQAFNALQGENELDITEFLSSGTNSVSLRVSNSENTDKSLAYTVTVAAVYLTSPFDASVPYTDAFSFPYTPTGIAEKTVFFELDGVVIGRQTVTTSGRQQSFAIPKQSHGSHVLRCWFTCNIDGTTVPSNVLYFTIICVAVPDVTPIIAVTSPPTTGVEQFSNIVKKYRVYSPASLTSPITLEVDGEVVADLTVNRTEHTWTYRADNVGEITQTIRCGEVSVSWTQTITESSIKVEAETEALALHLSSYGRSNAESNPGTWENNGYKAEFRDFNFVSDGWVNDEDDTTALRVAGDARLNIPYKMFADDFRTTGKTLEFELATRDVINYDAEVLTCWNGGRGFKITAQQLVLASEQSELGSRYKENEHIRVTFVAQKRSEYRLLLCYINGINSGAVQYPEDDDFSQATPVGITVGSNECTIDLYNIRAYDNSLTRHQVLDNWIADTRNVLERMERFKRNDVYDEYGQVVIEKLPGSLCYLVVKCVQLPQFKGDKKNCSGYFVDLVHPERSFSFVDAEIDVQGTSSQYYWRKNYKIKFKGGFILYDGSTVSVYAMNEDAVPVSTFTFKADVASSEGAYNTVSAKLYNELCPYQMPAQAEDPKYRYSIDGFPIVMFWEGPIGLQFLGKYNFNNDKGVPGSFGLRPGDERWEVLQNGTDRVGFHSADFTGDGWKEDFEGNYPDGNTDTTKLQAMCAWVNSTKGNPEKFAAELDQWFVPELIDWYYLFTELLLCMDQREKNVLWRYDASLQRWWADYYDADSIIGHNNQAQPVFDYFMEDIDHTASGDPVYNGQNSVFWQNVRATRYDNIKALYQEMRGDGRLSYEVVYNAIAEHQAAWPEAIFNEDMQTKCLDPLEQNGDGTYLPFLRGKKELWTKQWLYNRFGYMDSKYETGDSMKNRMTIRTNKMANVTLTAYVNMIGHVYYNAEHIPIRMERNVPYTFESKASGVEDRVIGINDANKLTSLGNLAPHDVELIDLSPCEMLTEIKLGDGAENYENHSLTSVTFGENKLLRKVDIRNCVEYAQAPDLSGCGSIEEVYAEGSAITGLKLPNGGILKTLHLPGTVVSLQIVNQPKLADFSIPEYSQITTLRLENAGAASEIALEILAALPENSRVRVIGFSFETPDSEQVTAFVQKLDSMRGIDENGNNTNLAQVSGSIHVRSVSDVDAELYEDAMARYVSLSITYDEVVPTNTVTFQDWDGTVLNVQRVPTGGDAKNPVTDGLIEAPSRESTVDTVYTFIGWSGHFTNILADTVVTAVYSEAVRTYTVNYWSDSYKTTLLQTATVEAYASAPYTGDDPVSSTGALWTGWTESADSVVSDMDIYPTWMKPVLPDTVATDYDYLYSDDPADKSAYTLEEFYGICYARRGNDYFTIGDKIKIVTNTSAFTDTEIVLRVIGYNHFKLADGSGDFAHVVFDMVGVMNETVKFGTSGWNSSANWYEWGIGTRLIDIVYPALPTLWKRMIKTVQVLSIGNSQDSTVIHTNEATLFPLSPIEVGCESSDSAYVVEVDADAESAIFDAFVDNASRVKKRSNGEGDPVSWYSRSMRYPDGYGRRYMVTASGSGGTANPHQVNEYISFAFCI